MKNKKTILYLRTDFSYSDLIAGGSVAHTLGVIQGFINHKWQLIVASTVMEKQLSPLAIKKLHVLSVPKKMLWLGWKLTSFITSVIFLKQAHALIKFNAVTFIYQRYSILNCTGVLLSYLNHIPLILEYNGSEVWVDKRWSSQKKFITFRWLIYLVESLNIHFAHSIIVVSQPLKDDLIERGADPKKILVNPNGVNTMILNPILLENDRIMIRNKLAIANKFVFGFIGTFGKWHGIEMLVAMIPSIVQQKSQAHFLLIGDGPLFSYAQQALQDYIRAGQVSFTGIIEQHEAKKYLAACDAFLSPTLPNQDGTPFFGSPTKLFEYLSMGKPIIASELNQVAEIVYPSLKITDKNIVITNQIGITITPGNIQEFIRAGIALIEIEKSERDKMGSNARIKAIEKYDWNHHVQKIIESIKNNDKIRNVL